MPAGRSAPAVLGRPVSIPRWYPALGGVAAAGAVRAASAAALHPMGEHTAFQAGVFGLKARPFLLVEIL